MTPPSSNAPLCKRFSFTSRGGVRVNLQVVAQSTAPPDDRVEKLVVICHGHERDALNVFKQARPQTDHSTVILAPHFDNGLDKVEYKKEQQGLDKLLVWKGDNWGHGGPSQYPDGANVSSFEAIDAIVTHYASSKERFPRLKCVTLAGHSMGGQLVQRYSILSDLCLDIPFSYVVMSPSTYLYPETYYTYKYGLAGIETALSSYSPALVAYDHLTRRISTRKVYYLVGARDNGTGDKRDEAMKQGATRKERLQSWRSYLQDQSLADNSTFEVVPNASHDVGQMIGSPQGVKYIF